MDKFTVEELNLMCIYGAENHTSDRAASREALRDSLLDGLLISDDPEMTALFVSTIVKLEDITDKEYSETGFYMADETDDYLTEGALPIDERG